MKIATLFVSSALVACGAPSQPPRTATPASSTADAPPSDSPPSDRPSPLPILLLVGGPGAEGELLRVEPEGGPPRPLGLRAEAGYTGSIEQGSTAPVLSFDGRWVAYVHDREAWVARADGSDARAITSFDAEGAEVLLAGWTPDSRGLLLGLWAEDSEDGPAPPEDAPLGFHLWSVDGGLTAQPALSAFVGFTDAGDALFTRSSEGRIELLAQPLAGGDARVVHTTTASTLGQISRGASGMVWSEAPNLVRADRGEAPRVVVEGEWAEYQWPQLDPRGERIAYIHRVDDVDHVEVRDADGSTQRPHRCENPCRARWHDADTLLVSDGRVLLVPLDGGETRALTDGPAEFVDVGVGR
ncbi:MAG: hypothetical protein SangKO_026650 [Sandaracinaceae bacterium]